MLKGLNELNELKGLPKGQYRVGALRANSNEAGWPAEEPATASPPHYRLKVPVFDDRWGSWVEFYLKGVDGDFRGEIEIRVIVDGQLLIHVGDNEFEFDDLPARVLCPPLDEYEVGWLILTEDHLPIILDESDLKFLGGDPRAYIETTPGQGFAIQFLEVTLDEIAHDSDSDRFFAGRVGLEGVELRVGDWTVGTSGLAGLLLGAEPEEEPERSTPFRVGSRWLFPVEGRWGNKGYIDKLGNIVVFPLVRR